MWNRHEVMNDSLCVWNRRRAIRDAHFPIFQSSDAAAKHDIYGAISSVFVNLSLIYYTVSYQTGRGGLSLKMNQHAKYLPKIIFFQKTSPGQTLCKDRS